MTILNLKVEQKAFKPSLIDVFNKYEDKDINICKVYLLVQWKAKNIPIRNSLSKILLKKRISEINKKKKVENISLNILLINQTNTLYYLKQSPQRKIKC